MPRWTVLCAAALLALSGCSDPKDPASDLDGIVDPGEAVVVLDASIPVQAPTWQVGQWWEWETSFGTQTVAGTRCSIVVSTDGAAYTLATEQTGWAKDEVAFGVPFLGSIGKSDLAMDGWDGEAWSLLSFPLTDGKTWTATMPNIAWDIVPAETVDLAMSASFDESIGQGGGYRITGMVDDKTLVEAEYDPGTGWFASLRFMDVDPGEEGLEFGLRATATGLNYTGPYFQHTGRPLVEFEEQIGFNDYPTEGGQPYTQPPQPSWSFTMAEGTTLYGYIIAESVGGGRGVVLLDPANNQHMVAAPGAPEGEASSFLDIPGIAGEWRLLTVGVGGYSGAYVALHEITEGGGTL